MTNPPPFFLFDLLLYGFLLCESLEICVGPEYSIDVSYAFIDEYLKFFRDGVSKVSLLYSNVDFTQVVNILSFVRLYMYIRASPFDRMLLSLYLVCYLRLILCRRLLS